ncbi:MAG: hypothetical protein AAGA08_05315 [Pseudomonadota bacterium]
MTHLGSLRYAVAILLTTGALSMGALAATAQVAMPAGLIEITTLDQCLADPAKTQAVFSERFPHETCDIVTSCDPNLVQSAQTLARERCRLSAIDACTSAPGSESCVHSLTSRWQDTARDIRADIKVRLDKLDPKKMSPFAIRRFGNHANFELDDTCAGLTRVEAGVLLGDQTLCGLYASLENVTRMEGLSAYLTDQEARP